MAKRSKNRSTTVFRKQLNKIILRILGDLEGTKSRLTSYAEQFQANQDKQVAQLLEIIESIPPVAPTGSQNKGKHGK